jgi:3-oxoacyl-[acyl-carrier protein] reductase
MRERGPCYNLRMSFSQQSDGVSFSLHGKVALVTGGSRGIGAATVRLLRQAGAKVVFSYRATEAQANALVAECGGEDVCFAIRQELASAEDGQALIEAAVKVFRRLDCLIVNHGVWPSQDQPISTMTVEQWRGTMGVNLDSVFGLVRAASAHMLAVPEVSVEADVRVGEETFGAGVPDAEVIDEQGTDAAELLEEIVYSDEIRWAAPSAPSVKGHIVLVASTAAQRGEAFHADYAASKGALLSLTKSLSSELAPQGILCNCVAPGWVRTEMSAGTLGDPIASKKALALIPLGRPAEPEEIAGPILFLCTPWAGFVSGEVFNVNGGAVLVG